MTVVVNGQERNISPGSSLEDLLRELELDPGMVVVEHNRSIVRRGNLALTNLGEGDRVEVVHFVGGG
jgi:thiazole synthase